MVCSSLMKFMRIVVVVAGLVAPRNHSTVLLEESRGNIRARLFMQSRLLSMVVQFREGIAIFLPAQNLFISKLNIIVYCC